MTKDSFNGRFRGLNHQGGGKGGKGGGMCRGEGEGGFDRRAGVWRKITGNAIGICASRSLGRTTICKGTGSGRPRGSFPSDRIAGMYIVGLNLGLLLRNMSAA